MSTTSRTYGHAAVGSRPRPLALALGLAAVVALTGCEVEWDGATVELEEPPPPERPEDAEPDPGTEPTVPLPSGPFLWAVELDPDGGGRARPVARLTDAGPDTLGWPEAPPEGYHARFDSIHATPGTELHLLARGRRLGSVVLGDGGATPSPGCPTAVPVRSLVAPGTDLPSLAFAVAPEGDGELPEPLPAIASSSRMRAFGPIVTERLFQEAGVGRSFLAQPADVRAVEFAGDTVPGMAATFLVQDTLAPVPPPSGSSGSSVSLFFIARFDGTGYEPVWSAIRSYDGAEDKEILVHQDWLSLSVGRVDLLRRVEADGTGLVGLLGVDGDDPRVVWRERRSCSTLDGAAATEP
ncbi:MAG: hypothetical protein ACOC83_02710 [Gemmatimonadota bacterium]